MKSAIGSSTTLRNSQFAILLAVGSSSVFAAPLLPHVYRSGVVLGPNGGTVSRAATYWKNRVYVSVDAESCQTGQQASSSTLYSVDVSNPDNLHFVYKGGDGGCKANGLVPVEDRLYVASWFQLLRIFDISQPGSFNMLGAFTPPDRASWTISCSNQRAYIEEATELRNSFYIVDVSNSANPTVVSNVQEIGGAAVRGSYSFYTRFNDLRVMNISDEANPYEMTAVNTGAKAGEVVLRDNYAFVKFGWPPDPEVGMFVYDISNPNNPVKIGQWTVVDGPGLRGFVLLGDLAFSPTCGNGFYSINISNPAAPYSVAQTEVPYNACEICVTANDRFAYVGTQEAGGGAVHAFQVLDQDADNAGPGIWGKSFTLGEASWDLQYECDAAPIAANPAWMLVDGSNSFASVSGGVLRINDNGTAAGDKAKWAINWDATNTRGTTVLARARCASHSANGSLGTMSNIFIRDGRFSEEFAILSDRLRAVRIGQEYPLDGTAWHTYRITTKGTSFAVYVDEAAVPVMTGPLGAMDADSRWARLWIGSGSSAATQDIYFDYVHAFSNGAVPPPARFTTQSPSFSISVSDSIGKGSLSGIDTSTARVLWSKDGGLTWSASGAAFWQTQYTGDLLPSAAAPSWSVPEGSEVWASVSGGLLRVNDTSTAGNTKVKWARSWNASPAVGTTLLTRARCASVGGDTSLLGNLFVEDGVRAEQFKIMPDRLVAFNAGLTYLLDGTQFHVYRVTTKNTQFSVYVDEASSPVMTGTLATSTSNNRVMFGSGASAGTQDIYFDYVKYSAGGDLPPGLGDAGAAVVVSCSPVSGVLPPDRGVLSTTGVPFNQNSDTLNKLRFSLDDLAGNTGLSPVYDVRILKPVGNPDSDGDGDVDQEDFGDLQACFSGEGVGYGAGCFNGDLDGDGDVDMTDFNLFTGCMNGPNQPPGC